MRDVRIKVVLFVAVALLTSSFLFAAGTVETTKASDPIYIGVAGPMTGDAAQQGLYAKTGAEIAAKEINAAGGINGRKIELVFMDDKGDPTESAMVAQRFIDDKRIFAVVGHMWSSCTLAAMPLYTAAGMPVLTPTASNTKVTRMGWDDLIRICLRDKIQGPQMAALAMNNLGGKKIGVIYSNDDYGRGVLEEVQKTAVALGSKIVLEEPYKPNIDKDFTVQLTKAIQAGVDVMILGAQQTEGGLIMSQAVRVGAVDTMKFVGNAGLLYQVFLDRMPAEAEGSFYISAPYDIFSEREVVKNFLANFKSAEGGTMPSETASYSYDAIYIIKDAMENGATRETLIDTIKSMKFDNLVVSNNVTFDKYGDRNEKGMFVVVVKDNQFVSGDMAIDVTGVTFEE